jgi:hypothetical protein
VNRRERLRILPHHRHTVGVHDHDSARSRFPALVPCSQLCIAGAELITPCDISLSFLGGKAPRRPVTVISTRKSESDPFRTSALVQKPRILCQVKVLIFASRITMVTPVALW